MSVPRDGFGAVSDPSGGNPKRHGSSGALAVGLDAGIHRIVGWVVVPQITAAVAQHGRRSRPGQLVPANHETLLHVA